MLSVVGSAMLHCWGSKTPEQRELGWAVYDKIKVNPEAWFQAYWARRTLCGSAFCFAGHTALLVGAEIHLPTTPDAMVSHCTMDGKWMKIETVASTALGLCPIDAGVLFSAVNRMEDLDRLVPLYFGPS